jgi:4'-phosphopantetheinyl transferase EntD
VLFSAKESVYKAWFAIAGGWLGFKDVLLTLDPERRTFHAHLFVDGPVVNGRTMDCLDGQFLVKDGLIITSVVLGAGL